MIKRLQTKQMLKLLLNGFLFGCAFVFVLSPHYSFGQDKIIKTDSTIIQAKVQEISDAEIKYKKFSNLSGPIYTVKKENVWKIVYENGEQETYNSLRLHPVYVKPVAPVRSTNFQQVSLPSSPGDQMYNDDLIVPVGNPEINCTIDVVNKNTILYHIKRRGYAPRGNIGLDQVIQYYYKQQWFYGTAVNPEVAKARNSILAGNINDAISSYYHILVNDSTNAVVLAEDAYALALGGIYDAALIRLDRCWSINANSTDVNYFTSQVLLLMGYSDVAAEFWKGSGSMNVPDWISLVAPALLQKYSDKSHGVVKESKQSVINDFKRANELAARKSNFQSIALFRKLIVLCPNEYLVYAGYSIVLEKAGALASSARAIENALALTGNKVEDRERNQYLQKRLDEINKKLRAIPKDALPGISNQKSQDAFNPQMMAYFGGTLAPSLLTINGRIGYYLSGASNAAFDIGVTSTGTGTSVNLALSGYFRKKALVTGTGLMMTSGSGTTSLSVRISVGASILNRNHKSSVDIFLDGTAGLTKGSLTTVGFSVGKSLYFGKRK
jgi:tetratricopeptide (TPR) repeat protein